MPPHEEADQTISTCRFEIRPRWQAPLHIAKLTRRAIALTPQGCQAPSFREGYLMGPKCADACHAGRPQAAVLWIHPGTSPPPEIDDFARLEANCSIFEQQPR